MSLGHEAALIREFRDDIRNENSDREFGGEAPLQDSGPPYFVYMVIG
jgi:hypothetical protein